MHKVVGGEHVLGFKSGNAYVRILHVRPHLRVGETVSVGDPLGEVAWSPTFFRWTDPHLHIEIRLRGSFIGARGGAKLSIHNDLVRFIRNNVNPGSSLREYIVDLIVKGRYVILKPCPRGASSALVVGVGNALGVMEGGVPHYGHAGVILPYGSADRPVAYVGSSVTVNDITIGQVDFTSGPYVHAVIPKEGCYLTLNGSHVYGAAFFIGADFVKVIPRDWRSLALSEGDVVTLCFQAP